MKDNFDLKKFLKENKTIENSNPFLKEAKEKKEKFDKIKLEKAIKAVLKKEGGAAGLKPLVVAAKKLGAEKKDLMGVLKKMSSVEKHRHGDYILKEESREERADVDKYEYEKGKESGEDLKSKIREMIINELSEEDLGEVMGYDRKGNKVSEPEPSNYTKPPEMDEEESLEEAKEDEEEEEVEAEEEEVTDEEGDEEEVESEETEEEPEAGGGIEDIAADMEGDEGDLMDHLISALKVSKGMDNDKLTTQIGNTLKFFVGEYIGGEE